MFHHLASPLTCWAFSFESGFTVPLSEWAFPWRTWCSCCCVEARSEGSERRPHWQWPPEGQDLHRETPDPRKSEKQATVSVFMTEKQHHPRPMKQATVSVSGTQKQHHPRPMKIWKNRPQHQFFYDSKPQKSEKQATVSVSMTSKQHHPRLMKIWKTGCNISFCHRKANHA